jgi:predicted MFS family arabinose efflux permease
MASRLGGALAPLMVIPLQQAFGWRVSFYVFGSVGLIWAAAWYWWFRDDPSDMSGITAAEIQAIKSGNPSRTAVKTPWRDLYRQPNLWWIMLMYHANAWCGFFYLTWLHTFLVNGRGFSPHELIALSWLPFVVGAVANIAGGAVSDLLVARIGLKWGRRALGFGGLGLAAVFLTATIGTNDKGLTIAFLALAYGCSDFALPIAWAVCLDVGREHVGVVTGSMNMAGQVGSFLTTVLFGYIVTAYGSYNAPLVPIAIMSLVGALAWLKIDATKPLLVGDGSHPRAGSVG